MIKKNAKAVTMLVENNFNTTLKQSSFFSDILNKVDLMDGIKIAVKQDEKITKIREKIKDSGSMLRFLVTIYSRDSD